MTQRAHGWPRKAGWRSGGWGLTWSGRRDWHIAVAPAFGHASLSLTSLRTVNADLNLLFIFGLSFSGVVWSAWRVHARAAAGGEKDTRSAAHVCDTSSLS